MPIETRSYVPGPNVIEIDEVVVKGKGKKQFRDKYMGRLDSIAASLIYTDDYVCEHGFLNCPNHKSGKKPVEGETYMVIDGKKANRVRYHYPSYTPEELLEKFSISCIKAYYKNKKFYQPKYDKKDESLMIPDFRNTLLWAPSVFTNEKGEATLEFFCSDIYTGFIGIIEGLSANGELGYEEFEFKVLKTKPFSWEK